MTRPNDLLQATCHVSVDHAASPTAQGAPGNRRELAMRCALSIAMQRGTDVVRCSTVAVRSRRARRWGTPHANAGWRMLAHGERVHARGRRAVRGATRRPSRRTGWPGYC
ncbi:hypothetical protein [Burkholderia sp. BCC0506]|uniref:hypothetical protein n=1 Tax=Burkholderia sp. BCC0506 TaxID=2676290 RepID=UPI001FC830B2|nr:hypothetical protein [Burkholderia sp. BCC0506]